VLLSARREDLVQEAAVAAGGEVIAMRADVTAEGDVEAMVARAAVRTRGHHVQERSSPGIGLVHMGADARELVRHDGRRCHGLNAVYPGDPEAVNIGAALQRDLELLIDGGIRRNGSQVTLRHGEGILVGVHKGRCTLGWPVRHGEQRESYNWGGRLHAGLKLTRQLRVVDDPLT
jgi:hypothetical protein